MEWIGFTHCLLFRSCSYPTMLFHYSALHRLALALAVSPFIFSMEVDFTPGATLILYTTYMRP